MRSLALICVLFSSAFAASTVELLAGDSRFSTLVSLVTTAGLVDTLNNGNFTIFAPTNAAFNKVPAATLSFLQSNVTALTNVLTYHVVSGNVMSSAASDELTVTTVNGAPARFNIYSHNNAVTIQGATISQFDLVADNGVIHVLDDVMMPPAGNIVDIVMNNPELSTLLSFVSQANLVDALKQDGLTVFAPTNAAFAKLAQGTVDAVNNDPTLLSNVLTFHVVGSTEYSAGLYQKEHLQPLYTGDDLVLHFVHHQNDIKVENALITTADIGATNGVIHLIDHVLIPHGGGQPVGK